MLENTLKKINYWGIILIIFLPLFTSTAFIFPFISLKNFLFRFIILFISIFFVWYSITIKKIRFGWIYLSFAIFFVVQTLASIFGVNFYYSLFGNLERMDGLFHIFLLFIFLLILINILKTKKNWLIVFRSLSISTILMSLFYSLGYYGIRFSIISLDNSGTIGNTAFFGVYMVLALFFLVIAYVYDDSKKWKYFYIINIILSLIIVFINASRGSILGLIAGIFIILLFLSFRSKKTVKYITIIFLFTVVLFGLLVFSNGDKSWVQNTKFLNRFASIASKDASSQGRLLIWEVGYKAFLDRPVFGYGPENILYGVNRYFNPQITENWFDRMHNFVFDYLDSSGILGLLSYLFIILITFLYILRYYKKDYLVGSVLFGFLASYLVMNFFVFDTINSWILIILFLAFISFLYKGNNKIDQEKIIPKFIYSNENMLLGFSTVISILFMYIFVFLPAQANSYALLSFKELGKNPEKSLEYLQKGIALNTFGSRELSMQLSKFYVENIADRSDVTLDIQKRFFESAEKNLLEIIKKDSEDVRTRMILAELYLKYSKMNSFYINEAINLINGTIQYSPTRVESYPMLAEAYLLRNEPNKAIEYLEKALEVNNTRSQDYLNIINVASQLKRKDLMDKYVNRFYENFYNIDSESYRKIGQYYFMAGYLADAERILIEKAIPSDPDNMKSYVSLASIYEYAKQHDKAISYLEDVIINHPDWSITLQDYIKYLQDLKNKK